MRLQSSPVIGGCALLGFGVSGCCAQTCDVQISDVPTNAAAKQMLKNQRYDAHT
jgi:hypothetical protein